MDKKILLLVFCGMFLVICSYSISATFTTGVNITSPANYSNYSTWINFSVTYDPVIIANVTNVTIYYNNTATTWTSIGTLTVCSNDSTAGNCTGYLSVASIDSGIYTFNATVWNITLGNYNAHISAYMVTVDNTPPSVIDLKINVTNYANFSTGLDRVNFTVNVTDALLGVDTILFNITNSAGDQVNWSVGRSSGNLYYNDVNTTSYLDGVYTITIYANDSYVNNTNSSESIVFRIDNTAPTGLSIARTTYSRTSLTLTGSASDATTGLTSCSIDRSGATITRLTATTWTITETGLGCSTSYDYIMTCTDEMSLSAASSSSSFSTDACAAGGNGGGGTTPTWTHTYVVNDAQLEVGYNKELGTKERMTVKVGTRTHTVGVTSLTATAANIEVSSDPVLITLNIGGEAKVDLSDDGFYDIQINLLGIANNKADVKVLKINQEVPEGGEPVSTTGEVTPIGEEEEEEEEIVVEEEEERSLTWLWIVIGALVVAGVVVWTVANKKK